MTPSDLEWPLLINLFQFKNNIINDEADTNMIMVSRSLDILEFECVYPTIQMTTGEINPLVQ